MSMRGCWDLGPSEKSLPFSADWRNCSSFFLRLLREPRRKNRVNTAARMRAISVSITVLEKTHHQHHANVDEHQDCKRVAERFVHHVPEVEDLLGAREKENAFGKRGFFARDGDGTFHFAVASGQHPAEGGEMLGAVERSVTQAGDAERPRQVEQKHVDQGKRNGEFVHRLLAGQAEGGAHAGGLQKVLLRRRTPRSAGERSVPCVAVPARHPESLPE